MIFDWLLSEEYDIWMVSLYFPDYVETSIYDEGIREFYRDEYKEVNGKYPFLVERYPFPV